MSSLGLIATMLCLSTLAAIINLKTFRLPATIGILLVSLISSLILLFADWIFPSWHVLSVPRSILLKADLPTALLEGALSVLLFAGAMQVNLSHLLNRFIPVIALVLPGTLLAIFILAGAMFFTFPFLGIHLPFIWYVVCGAILAPTDPVSVVDLLRRLGLPAPIQAIFAGESLFNDGVGVVAFGVAMTLATGSAEHVTLTDAVHMFATEAVGGSILGFITGALAIFLIGFVSDPYLDLLISLTLATGTFSLANSLGMSGPIAVVVAGLWLGSTRAHRLISKESRHELEMFWRLSEEVLNALLFLMIGAEILLLVPGARIIPAILIAIPLSLISRGASVFCSTILLPVRDDYKKRMISVLTWGGLRGGISVSLALGLPEGEVRNILAPICYGVVIFTILVQGLTMEGIVAKLYPSQEKLS